MYRIGNSSQQYFFVVEKRRLVGKEKINKFSTFIDFSWYFYCFYFWRGWSDDIKGFLMDIAFFFRFWLEKFIFYSEFYEVRRFFGYFGVIMSDFSILIRSLRWVLVRLIPLISFALYPPTPKSSNQRKAKTAQIK